MTSNGTMSSTEQLVGDFEGWVLQDSQTVEQGLQTSIADESVVLVNTQHKVVGPMSLGLHVEAALEFPVVTTDPGQLQAVISVVAPATPDTSRAPLRLVAVLDRSGSMHGEKLDLVRKTMLYMLRHLTERDALGLVAYDTQVSVLSPLTLCDAHGRARLASSLKRLQDGAQTNLSGGLLRGLELHREGTRADSAPTVQEQHDFLDAAKTHTFTLVRELIIGNPALVNCQPAGRWSALHHAAEVGDSAAITFLLAHGASINALTTDGQTPQDVAHPSVAELLSASPPAVTTLSNMLPSVSSGASSSVTRAVESVEGVVRSTFLFTDGLANVGITKHEDICAAVKAAIGDLGECKCSLSTFGFGKDHSAELLQNLAGLGAGIYSYVENEDQIGQAFGEALGGLLTTTHQNVKLRLELAPEVSLAQTFTIYPVDSSTEESMGIQVASVEVGDLFAEERRDILLTLALPAGLGSYTCGRLGARGFSVFSKGFEEAEFTNLLVDRQTETTDQQSHPQVVRHRNRHIMTKALEAAHKCAHNGDLVSARKIIDEAITSLNDSSLTIQGDEVCIGLLKDLNDCRTNLEHEANYRIRGSQMMLNMCGAHMNQRAMNSGEQGQSVYLNARSRGMRSMFSENVR